MKMYIANLEEYVKGNLVGKWFDLPCYEWELQEYLDTMEEYAIHDHEDIPFHVSEYSNPFKINKFCNLIEELDLSGSHIELYELRSSKHFLDSSIEELEEFFQDVQEHIYYDHRGYLGSDTDVMEDFAYDMYQELYGEIPSVLSCAIDWEKVFQELSWDMTYIIENNTMLYVYN